MDAQHVVMKEEAVLQSMRLDHIDNGTWKSWL